MKSIEESINKIPIIISQMHGKASAISGYDADKFYSDPQKLVEGIISVYELYDFNIPILGYDVYNIEAEAIGQEVIYSKNSSPQLNIKNKIIKGIEDFSKIKLSDNIEDNGRFSFVIKSVQEFIDKTGYVPYLQFTAPFSLASQLYGLENLIFDMMQKPDFVHEFMKILNREILIPWINYQKHKFPDSKAVLGADAFASPPNLTLSMLKEFVLPYIEDLKEKCGENVGVVNWWGDSYFKDPIEFYNLKKKVSPNESLIRIQDPDLNKLELDKIINYVNKNNLSLTLGLGAQVLSNGNKDEITKRIDKYILAGKKVEDFNLYFCSIGSDTTDDIIKYAIKRARTEIVKNKFWCYNKI